MNNYINLNQEVLEELVKNSISFINEEGITDYKDYIFRSVTDYITDVFNEIMEIEMNEHLGYKKNEIKGNNSGNSRNGYYTRGYSTTYGKLELKVPRDRLGTFRTSVFELYKRSQEDLITAIIELYCTGSSNEEIKKFVLNNFGAELSPSGISNVIKVIDESVKEFHNRKLATSYKVIFTIDITIKTKHKFPYEFICWNTFTSDLNVLDTDLKTYIETNCKQQLISKNDMLNLLTKEYTLRWFITPSENILIKLLVDGIYKEDEPNIEDINEKIKDSIDKIFDEKEVIIWQNRFFNLIYLLRNNSLLKEADNFYTILKNNDLFTLFKVVIIQRSIFNYYVGLKENIKESFFTTNIFSKKNATSKSYDIKKIEKIINILKRHWIDE